MAEEQGTAQTKSRTDAASIIAELWAEREQAAKASAPASPTTPPNGKVPRAEVEPKAPRTGGRERALATVIVLLLVGAGAGIGAKAAGLVGAPSKATFIAQADAACAPGNAGVSAMAKPVGYQSVATSAQTLVTTTDAQLGALRALELPGRADRNGARNVLNALAATGDAGRSLQSAAGASDPAMTVVASKSMSLYASDAVAKAQAFGLTACVTGLKPGVDTLVAGANGAVKTSFVEKATAACMELLKGGTALNPKVRTPDDLTKLIDQTVALYDKLAADIKALPVPPGDEATVTTIVGQIGNVSTTLRSMASAALAGDVKRVNAIQKEGDALLEDLSRKMGDYGLTVCGK